MFDSWLRSSLSVLALFLSATVLADGYVIYSSWQLEWRARTEAVRTTDSLNVDAMVKQARVFGQDWYRVVVKVDSESGERTMLDAFDRDWDVWYLSSSDSSWVSDGTRGTNPLVSARSGETTGSMIGTGQEQPRVDTVAPASLVAKPLFSEDGDSAAFTLAPSASGSTPPSDVVDPTDVADPQVVVETETDAATSEPEDDVPSVNEEETLPAEPEADTVVSTDDGADDSTLSVESTLREVEMIQRQAQDLISNWEQREDPTTYVLPTETDTNSRESQALAPTRESWFNEMRIPDVRRR